MEVQVSLFQSSKSACSLRIWRYLSFSKMRPSLIFFVASMSNNKLFIIALLWRAKFSRAAIEQATRCWGSEFQMKIGSFTRFEEMETEMGICFPIHFLVSVSLKLSSCTQIDSKSKESDFWKVFPHWCIQFRRSPACQTEFHEFDICSLDRNVSLVHCMYLNVAPNWMFCWKKYHS